MCYGEIISDTLQKARKRHICSNCRRAIKPGERYQRQFQRDNGDISVWKGCKRCMLSTSQVWEEANYSDDACYDQREQALTYAKEYGWKSWLSKLRRIKNEMVAPRNG